MLFKINNEAIGDVKVVNEAITTQEEDGRVITKCDIFFSDPQSSSNVIIQKMSPYVGTFNNYLLTLIDDNEEVYWTSSEYNFCLEYRVRIDAAEKIKECIATFEKRIEE